MCNIDNEGDIINSIPEERRREIDAILKKTEEELKRNRYKDTMSEEEFDRRQAERWSKLWGWIFFDIGSTLVDESECYRARYTEAVKNSDITYEEFENKVIEYSKQNKKGDHEAVKYFNLTLPKWHKGLESLYPEAETVLKSLLKMGYRLGIIANQSIGSEERLEEWGIRKYFSVVIASAEEGVAKPDKEIFLRALKKANCDPQNAFMVGDRLDNDIVPANEIGMKTVWIKQGLGGYATPKEPLEYPDYTVNDLTELCDLFNTL